MDRTRDGFLYANMNVRWAGVKCAVYLSQHGPDERPLTPRIEVYPNGFTGDKHFHLSIAEEPSVLKKSRGLVLPDDLLARAVQFVKVNRQVLIHYWDNIDAETMDMLTHLDRLEDPPAPGQDRTAKPRGARRGKS